MKIVFPGVVKAFEVRDDKVNSLIIENQNVLVMILMDLVNQLNGGEGNTVLSEDGRIIKIKNCCELLSQFVPFELNTKGLLSKLTSALENRGISADNYETTQELLCSLESYLYKISFEMSGDIVFSKINLQSIIKAVGPGFAEEYDNLAEKIIDYMELVKEYDRDKLFITLNLRDYLDDPNMEDFIDTVLNHNIKVFMIESKERTLLNRECRYIIDQDLCEIC